jgi:putative transposase
MVERDDDRITRTNGMSTWRAGCAETCTSGSEGGPGKPASRKAGRAPRSDPYTEHPTSEGKLYLCAVKDA